MALLPSSSYSILPTWALPDIPTNDSGILEDFLDQEVLYQDTLLPEWRNLGLETDSFDSLGDSLSRSWSFPNINEEAKLSEKPSDSDDVFSEKALAPQSPRCEVRPEVVEQDHDYCFYSDKRTVGKKQKVAQGEKTSVLIKSLLVKTSDDKPKVDDNSTNSAPQNITRLRKYSKKQYKIHDNQYHNIRERSRREHLRIDFATLKGKIPSLHRKNKSTKKEVLDRAVEYCQELTTKLEDLQKCKRKEVQKKKTATNLLTSLLTQ